VPLHEACTHDSTTKAPVTTLIINPTIPNFFLPVRVLSKLFRHLMLEKLIATHQAGRLQFLSAHAHLAKAAAFAAFLAPLRTSRGFESAA
jgi:hypothetical protein